jgi:hypothetical protein
LKTLAQIQELHDGVAVKGGIEDEVGVAPRSKELHELPGIACKQIGRKRNRIPRITCEDCLLV